MYKFQFILAVSILAGCGLGDDTWEIHGHVVDEHGKPVEEFDAARFWFSNGRQWDETGQWIRTINLEDIGKLWKEEGVLAAHPASMAKRLPGGRFRHSVNDRPRVSIFAVDEHRTRGGVVSVENTMWTDSVTIKLLPLVRVHGKIYCPEAGSTPDRTMAIVHPPGDQTNDLHFTKCGSVRGEFSFLLPPGKYDIEIDSFSPNARMPRPAERKTEVAPADMPPYLGGIRVEVPAQAELDLGVLNVELHKDKHGIVREYSVYHGKVPPELSITDARGVAKDVKLADFRGKWVLLDFWALWCGPCIDELSELARFYEEHATDHDRFEILAICNTELEKVQTIKEFDVIAAPLVKKEWAGKQLPFPVLIDGEGQTSGMYGIQEWPTVLLIDPDGHLVKFGDETTLARELQTKH